MYTIVFVNKWLSAFLQLMFLQYLIGSTDNYKKQNIIISVLMYNLTKFQIVLF